MKEGITWIETGTDIKYDRESSENHKIEQETWNEQELSARHFERIIENLYF